MISLDSALVHFHYLSIGNTPHDTDAYATGWILDARQNVGMKP